MNEYMITDLVAQPIGKGNGSKESPFLLTRGDFITRIINVNMNECYASLPSFSGSGDTESVYGGHIVNTDGSYMFKDCLNLYNFDCTLDNLVNAEYMFQECRKLKDFNVDMPLLENANFMFNYCTTLSSFTSNIPNLKQARQMFQYSKLTNWNTPLDKLENANGMFVSSFDLKTFNANLPLVTNAKDMFATCSALTDFSGTLDVAENTTQMFYQCHNLSSCTITSLPQVLSASSMFEECKQLSSITLSAPNLTSVSAMFRDCTSLKSVSAYMPNLSTMLSDSVQMFLYSDKITKVTLITNASFANLQQSDIGLHNASVGYKWEKTITDENDGLKKVVWEIVDDVTPPTPTEYDYYSWEIIDDEGGIEYSTTEFISQQVAYSVGYNAYRAQEWRRTLNVYGNVRSSGQKDLLQTVSKD